MSQKEHIGFRVPQDTYQAFESYREERNISKTDAGRRLLEDALHDTDGGEEPGRGLELLLGVALGLLFAVVALAVTLGGPGAGLVVGAAALVGVGTARVVQMVR